jgi:hypothetical protein
MFRFKRPRLFSWQESGGEFRTWYLLYSHSLMHRFSLPLERERAREVVEMIHDERKTNSLFKRGLFLWTHVRLFESAFLTLEFMKKRIVDGVGNLILVVIHRGNCLSASVYCCSIIIQLAKALFLSLFWILQE